MTGRILRPYVVPMLTCVDLRAKSALAEEALSKLSVFAQPLPPPTSASNVEGGTVFGPQGAGTREPPRTKKPR